jgi:hypothetical protein
MVSDYNVGLLKTFPSFKKWTLLNKTAAATAALNGVCSHDTPYRVLYRTGPTI